nr:hypothetical protein [Xanthomonas sp. WHRI 8812E]MEA9634646.1 hypothetical protein [Xanthomonas sp. WHRI 8812E]
MKLAGEVALLTHSQHLVGKWRSCMKEVFLSASTELSVVQLSLAKADVPILANPDLISIFVILAIVLPETRSAVVKTTTLDKLFTRSRDAEGEDLPSLPSDLMLE